MPSGFRPGDEYGLRAELIRNNRYSADWYRASAEGAIPVFIK